MLPYPPLWNNCHRRNRLLNKKFSFGFTLIELLVAVAIFGILMGLFFSFWSVTMKATRGSYESAQKYMGARVFLETLARELRSAPAFNYLHYKNFYWGPDPNDPNRMKLSFWSVTPDEIQVLVPFPFYVYRISYFYEVDQEEEVNKIYKKITPVFPGKHNIIKGVIYEGDFDFKVEVPIKKGSLPLPPKVIFELVLEDKYRIKKVVYVNALKRPK